MRGNIRQRAKGTWTLTIELPQDPETGKRRQTYETVRGTKRDALRRLSELEVQVDRGEQVNPSRGTVAEFLNEWLDGPVQSSVRLKTADGYRFIVRNYIAPRIGQFPLRDLQPAHLQGLYSGLLAQGLSATTTRHAHAVIRRALAEGVRMGRLGRNVALATRPPRSKCREMSTLSVDDVR